MKRKIVSGPAHSPSYSAHQPVCNSAFPEAQHRTNPCYTQQGDTGEPMPAKLVQALRDFSHIELHWFLPATLVPSGLNLEDCTRGKCHCCRPIQAKGSRKTVADISIWLLCFNRYVAALCSVYPGMLPHMLAYANIIIQAQVQFTGEDWPTYDQMFRTAAATSRNTEWQNVNASLYAHSVSC